MPDLDAAIEAAAKAIHDVDCPDGPACFETQTTLGRYGRYARAALDAAAPLIRADERANVRAELLADEIGEVITAVTEQHRIVVDQPTTGSVRPCVCGCWWDSQLTHVVSIVLRELADRIAPEPTPKERR